MTDTCPCTDVRLHVTQCPAERLVCPHCGWVAKAWEPSWYELHVKECDPAINDERG